MAGPCLSNQGGDVGLGEKTPLPVRDGEGCRPHAAGRSSFRFHLACTDSACVGVGGGGGMTYGNTAF